MKEIRAYIQPFMLPRVTQTLLKIPGFPGMNVSDCEGFDGNPAEDGFTPYTPKKRIEIFAPDELVKIIFDTLIQAANTHHSDAGKVYLIEVSKNGRINDGASGNPS